MIDPEKSKWDDLVVVSRKADRRGQTRDQRIPESVQSKRRPKHKGAIYSVSRRCLSAKEGVSDVCQNRIPGRTHSPSGDTIELSGSGGYDEEVDSARTSIESATRQTGSAAVAFQMVFMCEDMSKM